jgi:hypothetical protein
LPTDTGIVGMFFAISPCVSLLMKAPRSGGEAEGTSSVLSRL